MDAKQYKHRTIRVIWFEGSEEYIKIFANNGHGFTETLTWHLTDNPLFEAQIFICNLLQRGITELYIYDSVNAQEQHLNDINVCSYCRGQLK